MSKKKTNPLDELTQNGEVTLTAETHEQVMADAAALIEELEDRLTSASLPRLRKILTTQKSKSKLKIRRNKLWQQLKARIFASL